MCVDTKWNEKANKRKTNNRANQKQKKKKKPIREINNIWNRYYKDGDDELHTCSCATIFYADSFEGAARTRARAYNER